MRSGKGSESRREILIVDDVPRNHLSYRRSLMQSSFRPAIAENQKTAEMLFERRNPEVILLNDAMIFSEGKDLVDKIRAFPHLSQTPIIALTSDSNISTVERMLDWGYDHFFPLRLINRRNEFLSIIESAAERL